MTTGKTIAFKRPLKTGTWTTARTPQGRVSAALALGDYVMEEAILSVEEDWHLRNQIDKMEQTLREITRNMCSREDLTEACRCTLHPDVPERYEALGQLFEELSELVNSLLPQGVWFGIGPHGPTGIGLYKV